MSTALLEYTLPAGNTATNNSFDLCHCYCNDCYPDGDRAYCGTDLSGDDEVEEDVVDCVVCIDIEWCPNCGSYEKEDMNES